SSRKAGSPPAASKTLAVGACAGASSLTHQHCVANATVDAQGGGTVAARRRRLVRGGHAVSEKAVEKSTRRDLLRLAGAAAIGAAGISALGAVKVKAAGSGTPLVAYLNPIHVASGHLNAGQEAVIGPFPYPGSSAFGSDDYWGMVGNLTAT